MARLFQIEEIEARKRALAAESDIYRETLRLDAENLRACVSGMKRRLAFLSSLGPLLAAGLPLARSLLARRKRRRAPSWLRLALALALRWGLHRRLGDLLRRVLAHPGAASGSHLNI